MKKLLIPLFVSAFALTSAAEDYYKVNTATTSEATAPYIESSALRLLWCANGVNGTLSRGLVDYFVKVRADSTVSILGAFGSGGGGKFNNMVVALENNSTLALTSTSNANIPALAFNPSSNVVHLFKFQLATGATSATVSTTGALAYFSLSYNSTSEGADTIDRGIIIDNGVTLSTAGSLIVTNSTPTSKTPIFDVKGNISVAEGYSISFENSPLTQASTSSITADKIGLFNSTATFGGTVAAKTSGARTSIILNGGTVNLATGAANTLENAVVSSSDSSSATALNISNSMSLYSYVVTNKASSLNVAAGKTLTVGATTSVNLFNNNGTGTINGNLLIYSKDAAHNASTVLGALTIDGGSVTETSGGGSYGLTTGSNNTVKLINGASVNLAKGFLGISGNGTYDVDATSLLNVPDFSFFGGGGSLKLASVSNLKTSNMGILVNGPSGSASTANLYLTAGTGIYSFGKISFLRTSNLNVHLGGAEVSFNGVDSLNGVRECTSTLVFYDFAESLVKLNIDETILSADGTITLTASNTSLKLSAYDTDGNLLDGDWSVDDNGYLFNSALVPEPAEWAAIFGALALALAMRRRRK